MACAAAEAGRADVGALRPLRRQGTGEGSNDVVLPDDDSRPGATRRRRLSLDSRRVGPERSRRDLRGAGAAAAPQPDTEAPDNDSAAKAQPLPLGQEARGHVQAQHDEDWHRIDVPAGQNRLTLTLSGQPSIDVEATAARRRRPRRPPDDEGDDPRADYRDGRRRRRPIVYPPHPAAVPFGGDHLDTSMSLGPYITFVFQAVGTFAGDVVAGQEAVNFLPFGADFLLDASGRPTVRAAGRDQRFPARHL